MNSNRAKTFDDDLFSPVPSPLKLPSPKSSPRTEDKTSQDCRGISSSVTVLRPRNPTQCTTGGSGMMEFVERSIKDSFNSEVPCPWEDIICAFSAMFLFRSSSGTFIPDVDMQMYWCNFCKFKSKEKREMITHSMSHRFKCNYCDQECFTRSDVVKHSIRNHSEYKFTRNALKACMLLNDLLEQDETAIMFGGKNLDTDDKSESVHLEYDQHSTNSNHGSSNGGDFPNSTATTLLGNQNSQTSKKIDDTYSMFPSSKKDLNESSNDEESTTLPLEITDSRSLVDMTHSLTESNTNGTNAKFFDLASSESNKQHTNTGPIALISDIQSDVESSENNADMLHNLISSTEETDLQIVNVQSTNSFNANIVTISSAEESDVQIFDSKIQPPVSQSFDSKIQPPVSQSFDSKIQPPVSQSFDSKIQPPVSQSFDSKIQPPVSQQNPTTETIQLLASLNLKAEEKRKEIPDDIVSKGPEETLDERKSGETLKRKATELTVDSSAEDEDEDDDPNYQPEKAIKTERVFRKRKKTESKLSKEVSVKKKSSDDDDFNTDDLPVGVQFFRCCYCRYRTLKKRKVDGHLRQKHSTKTVRYTRLVVNSNREIVRDERHSSQKSHEFEVKSSSSPPKIKTDDGENEVNDKYACMFCNYKSANVQIIRQHMFRLHPSKKFCCIDNVLKQQGKSFYTFFCCRHKCNFLSIEPQKYVEHVEKCTPLPKTENEDSSKPTGLQQSVTFAQSLQDGDKIDVDRVSKKESTDERNYSCHRCSFSAVGDEAMKNHMLSKHPNLHMIALVKKSDSTLDFYLFCPEENCKFITQEKHELDIHAKQTHMTKSSPLDDEDYDIKPFGDHKDGEPIEKNTMTYMPAYECLYCETSCISTSLMNMKRHVQETHPLEVIIVRDCVAYKRKRPSRIYVCDTAGCIFNDLDYKEYLTHVIAHKGGTLYGCANCNWAGQEKKDFTDHMKRQKGIKHSLVETGVIMKEDGTIVKTLL